jgi:hypothetical protein
MGSVTGVGSVTGMSSVLVWQHTGKDSVLMGYVLAGRCMDEELRTRAIRKKCHRPSGTATSTT